MRARIKTSEMEQQFLTNLYRLYTDKEPVICSVFGCGKKLSNQEELFGNKCVKHSGNKQHHLTNVFKGHNE